MRTGDATYPFGKLNLTFRNVRVVSPCRRRARAHDDLAGNHSVEPAIGASPVPRAAAAGWPRLRSRTAAAVRPGVPPRDELRSRERHPTMLPMLRP